MGSPCLFTRQRAPKMGYFYLLGVKNSNHLSLGYPKDPKFYLESKASFIDICSIASFKLVLVVWSREYCTFSDSSMVALAKIHPVGDYFPKKNVLLSNFLSSSNMIFIRVFLGNT